MNDNSKFYRFSTGNSVWPKHRESFMDLHASALDSRYTYLKCWICGQQGFIKPAYYEHLDYCCARKLLLITLITVLWLK